MTDLQITLNRFRFPQWILLIAGICSITAAVVVGIPDNLPMIILLMVGIALAAAAPLSLWGYPKKFWILGLIALASFPLGVVFHNLLYALGTILESNPILGGFVGILEMVFFILAVVFSGPLLLVSLVGGIVTSWDGYSSLVARNRSYRRFYQDRRIPIPVLRNMVDLTRRAASSANRQMLKYIISVNPDSNQKVFSTLGWAGYLKDWQGPAEGERPSAYIIILGDKELGNEFKYDAGIAAQTILLAAAERGLGGCMIASVRRDQLREKLEISESLDILLVIALGLPRERVLLELVSEGDDIQYWRDARGIHHVPKRPLDEILIQELN